jgi:hypothetical protein
MGGKKYEKQNSIVSRIHPTSTGGINDERSNFMESRR